MIQETLDEAALFLEQDATEAAMHSIAGGLAAVFSARCPGKETPNEDAAVLIPTGPDSCVLAVADGVGGVRAGNRASNIALDELRSSLAQEKNDESDLQGAILNAIETANQAVLELGIGAATTLAVVEINRNTVRPYHVGDSTILVFGQRGKIKLQTVAHSPVGFAVEAGLLNEKEAMQHKDRHIVSNVIGIPDMRIEVGSTLELAQRDTLLLASDGLMDNLQTSEIIERLRRGPLASSANVLAADTMQRMTEPREGEPSKPDDMTFVIFRGRKI